MKKQQITFKSRYFDFQNTFQQNQKKITISADKFKDNNDIFNEDSNTAFDYLRDNFKINFSNDSHSNHQNQKKTNNLIEPIFQEEFNNKNGNTIINNKDLRSNFGVNNKKNM